ncbi:UPF0029-domain-containing protein [Amniculicola lignicola CBS 123094]|uniref:UPF0029-domain-containing protein n=1 Tax=Amniculicola lignicola CBS 123094 TaxID=1392246 RepID=A0A6A5W3E0_9PLEO|nr:UPF0029-domain-containing protein [Amniculicola lignicola CBS 123094]
MSTAINEALTDEITSINSIFDEDSLSPIAISSSTTSDNGTLLYSLKLPSLPSVTLRLEFPSDYPDAPPSILGTQHVGDDVQKGVGSKIVDIVRDVLAQVYNPGEPCIFDLVEEVREALETAETNGTLNISEQSQADLTKSEPGYNEGLRGHDAKEESQDLGPEPPWIIASPVTEKKSIFLARSAHITSVPQAKSYLHQLLSTDKKVARATHNITAWRIRGPPGTNSTFQDCDDDGETAAGGRLLHLLQLMDVWNVMVVVTRWYGGVQLGPDRFRIINSVAREAVLVGGFGKEGMGMKEGVEGKKKGRK